MLFFLLSLFLFSSGYNLMDLIDVSKQKKRQNFFRVTITNLHVQMSYHASVIRVTIS